MTLQYPLFLAVQWQKTLSIQHLYSSNPIVLYAEHIGDASKSNDASKSTDADIGRYVCKSRDSATAVMQATVGRPAT